MTGVKKCTICGSTTTYLRNGKWEEWYHWEGKLMCSKCYAKRNAKRYRQNNPEKVKTADRRKQERILYFKGREIRLKYPPRRGICSKCGRSVVKGEIKKTNIHHEKYDENNPLAHTIELCVSCHVQVHKKLRQIGKA